MCALFENASVNVSTDLCDLLWTYSRFFQDTTLANGRVIMATLLTLTREALLQNYLEFPETGMAFQVVRAKFFNVTRAVHCLVLSDGMLLPYVAVEGLYYSVRDWIRDGTPPEMQVTEVKQLFVEESYSDRPSALAALQELELPRAYVPTAGAVPLLASLVLNHPHILYRFVRTSIDPAYQNGKLRMGTYLTSLLDQFLTNTGFGAVGRYALPIPLPAVHVFQYELPAGSRLRVGTVSPMFGQSGGGVELKLDNVPNATAVRQIGHAVIGAF